MTWPQAAHLGDGLSDWGDAKLVTRILHWDFRQTFRDPVNLFHLNFFHPSRYVLAFSENFYGVALFGFPVLAAGAPALLNYNLLLLLGMFLSALSAWALARYVTGDPLAAVVAGLIFAFVPWRFSQLAHLQFQWGAFLCLLLLFLLRYLDQGRTRDAALFSVAFGWNALCNVHYALFSGFLVAVTLLLYAREHRPEGRRRVRVAVLATALGALVFLPFALAYRRATEIYGMQRLFGEMEFFSGRWKSFLSAGDPNRLYGPLTVRWRAPEGDFFPGLAALGLAGIGFFTRSRDGRPEADARPEQVSRGRRRWAVALDVAIVVLAGLWIASLLVEGLTLGPLRLRDSGRIQVFLTVAVLARLATAPPKWVRPVSGWLWRRDRRVLLFTAIGILGVIVSLGAHTPYYRFLFQSFGDVFRAIRAPARGIVLFHLALAVLATSGLASLLRNRTRAKRLAATAVIAALVGTEYRAFPLRMYPTTAAAPPVYDWLGAADFPGAAVEWPLGIPYDFDYVFRQTAHEKPLVNGASGFFPRTYAELATLFEQRPIPESVWDAQRRLGASVLIYHSHDGRGLNVIEYAYAVRRELAAGKIELAGVFPHAGGRDLVFRLRDGKDSAVGPAVTGSPDAGVFEEVVRELEANVGRLAPPFGNIHLPAENQKVVPGFWVHGWALDDSGLREIRTSTELGPGGVAMLGGKWPSLPQVFPGYPDVAHGGFGFPVPDLAPGRHTLRLTLIAKDGGTTVLERPIVVLPAPPPSPTPRR